MKRPPKPKAKTLSLSSPVGDEDELWGQDGGRRKLRPIVDSVFGQVGWTSPVELERMNKGMNEQTDPLENKSRITGSSGSLPLAVEASQCAECLRGSSWCSLLPAPVSIKVLQKDIKKSLSER